MPVSIALAGVSAVASIAGGIMGSRSAAKQNAANRRAQEEQQKLLNKQAKLQNKFNKKSYAAEIENYRRTSEYNFETAVKDWMYKTTIRALEDRTNLRKFYMNKENVQNQLTFNKIADEQGKTREQLALNDAKTEFAFNQQDALIAELVAQGKAQLGQGGVSRTKTMQSSNAKFGRDLAVLNASLTGEITASHLRMFDISLGRYAADARAEASRMLRPERLPAIPAPTRPPQPIFIEPMKVLPGMAAPAQKQSTIAPIMQGISGAAGAFSGINFGGGGGTGQPAPPPTIGQNSGYIQGFGGTFGPNYGIK